MFDKKAKYVQLNPFESNSDGLYRRIKFFDAGNNEIGGVIYNLNPLFQDNQEIKREIPADHDVVGLSLTTDQNGHIVWANFVLWPTNQEINWRNKQASNLINFLTQNT